MKRSCGTQSASYWDGNADTYDEEVFVVWQECTNSILEDTLSSAAEKFDTAGHGDECCVDFGTGCGKALPFLSHFFSRVVGLDHSPKLIKAARVFCDSESNGASKNKASRTNNCGSNMARCFPEVAVCDLSTGKSVQRLVSDVYKKSQPKDDASSTNIRITCGICCNVLLSPALETRRAILSTIYASMATGGRLVCIVPSLESKLFMESLLRRWDREEACAAGIASLYCKPYSLCSTASSCMQHAGAHTRKLGLNDVLEGVLPAGGTPTCHFLAAQLENELGEAGFRLIGRVEKVPYAFSTEFVCSTPTWMRKPHVSQPWDWLAVAEKI